MLAPWPLGGFLAFKEPALVRSEDKVLGPNRTRSGARLTNRPGTCPSRPAARACARPTGPARPGPRLGGPLRALAGAALASAPVRVAYPSRGLGRTRTQPHVPRRRPPASAASPDDSDKLLCRQPRWRLSNVPHSSRRAAGLLPGVSPSGCCRRARLLQVRPRRSCRARSTAERATGEYRCVSDSWVKLWACQSPGAVLRRRAKRVVIWNGTVTV